MCKTSNPSSADFQDLTCEFEGDRLPLYQVVARRAAGWNRRGNVGLVVGATYPDEARRLRMLAPDRLFLMPGIGAQGGNVGVAVGAGLDAAGSGVLLSASRSVLYGGSAGDLERSAAAEARSLREAANAARAPATVRP